MAGQTLSTIAEALKKDYHGTIVDELNNMSPLATLLEKNSEDVSGENLQAVVSLKTARNQGAGARAESAALPSARYVKTMKLAIPLAYNYGGIQFTGQVIKASEKSPTAFANAVDLEVKGMVETMELDTNRQWFGQADGHLCMTNGAGGGASSTITVDKPGTQWLQEGMPIESFAALSSSTQTANEDISEGLTESTAYTVFQILSDTTFTLGNAGCTAAVTTEVYHDDHYITRWGARGNEMMGLRGIIADNTITTGSGSWFGLDELTTIYYTGDGSTAASRATYPVLDSVIKHNSGVNRAVSEKLIQGLLDEIEKKSGKKGDNKSLMMMTTYGVRANYTDLLQADRRYVKPLDLVGGWKAIAYQAGNDEVPILVDRMALPNAICTLDRRFLKIYRASDYDWMDFDGNMFQRKIDSSGKYDAYEATMFCYQNLGCTSFKNQGALRDLSE